MIVKSRPPNCDSRFADRAARQRIGATKVTSVISTNYFFGRTLIVISITRPFPPTASPFEIVGETLLSAAPEFLRTPVQHFPASWESPESGSK